MEDTLYVGRTHPKALFRSAMIQLVLLAVHVFLFKLWPSDTGWDFFDQWGQPIAHGLVLAFEAWYVVFPIIRWRYCIFTLTNKRVKADWGVLYTQSREIDLTRIASISEERGILDRLFGCGTLNFYDAASESQPKTSGAWNKQPGSSGVSFHDVPRIKEVRELVEAAKYNAKPRT